MLINNENSLKIFRSPFNHGFHIVLHYLFSQAKRRQNLRQEIAAMRSILKKYVYTTSNYSCLNPYSGALHPKETNRMIHPVNYSGLLNEEALLRRMDRYSSYKGRSGGKRRLNFSTIYCGEKSRKIPFLSVDFLSNITMTTTLVGFIPRDSS